MARRQEDETRSRRAMPSADARQDRALASDAEEPHPAGELLTAGRPRSGDRSLRRQLQPPAPPREPKEPYARRRLLRAWADHFAGTRENQKEDVRKTALAARQNRRLNCNQG